MKKATTKKAGAKKGAKKAPGFRTRIPTDPKSRLTPFDPEKNPKGFRGLGFGKRFA